MKKHRTGPPTKPERRKRELAERESSNATPWLEAVLRGEDTSSWPWPELTVREDPQPSELDWLAVSVRLGGGDPEAELRRVVEGQTRRRIKREDSSLKNSDMEQLTWWLGFLDSRLPKDLDETDMIAFDPGRVMLALLDIPVELDEIRCLIGNRKREGKHGTRRGPLPFLRMAAGLTLSRAGKTADDDAVTRFLAARRTRRKRKRRATL